MNLKNICIYITLIGLFSSCVSIEKRIEDDYYKVTNLMINNAIVNRDSVYVFQEFTVKDLKKRKKEKFHELYYIIRYKEEALRKNLYDDFIEFLNKNNIDLDKELSYFKKQLDKPIELNTNKVELKKFRVVIRNKTNLDKYYLRSEYSDYNHNFALNLFSYSRPVFTRNGKYAIAHYKSYYGKHFFIIFKKNYSEWTEIGKYNSFGNAKF